MKDKIREQIMSKCTALRPKISSYLMDLGNNDKKAKGTKKMSNQANT